MFLAEKHLEKAKEIAYSSRKKKRCDHCYDRAYIGVNQENLLIICPKCVDMDKAMEAWKEYVIATPELHEDFKEMLEEGNGEGNPEENQES